MFHVPALKLARLEGGGFSDPYVRVSLEPPVDALERQTSVKRNRGKPFFDQYYKFPVHFEQLDDKTLVLKVYDDNR